ncbi:MAG: VanZ family protein [Flavobacteriales bacterium]|nr:VanZ family protein [Flavobacteriales bacterium]
MAYFRTSREKRLWTLTAALLLLIYATHSAAPEFSSFLREKGLLTPIFITVFFLIAAVCITLGLFQRPDVREVAIWAGITGVLLMLFFRIEMVEERSHLMEYGVISILIYEALKERGSFRYPALVAILLTGLFGFIDEAIQYFIPTRVFAWEDVVFNISAAMIAMTTIGVLRWTRERFRQS